MSHRIKVQGGTLREEGDASLCTTCSCSTIIKGSSFRETIIACSRLGDELGGTGARINFPVKECSGYIDKQHPPLYAMEQMAWVLRTDKGKKAIGFVPMKDLTMEEKQKYTVYSD